MGYAKYHEDNIMIEDDRNYERIEVSPNKEKIIYHQCYYCNHEFESIEGRNQHIKAEHNVAGPLLLVNGKIVSNDFYVDKIHSAKVFMCGFEGDISIDNKKITNEEQEIDLKEYFEESKEAYIIKILDKKFQIFKYTSSNIDNLIVNEIIEKWENQVSENIPLKPMPTDYPNELNEAEKRYLNGFYNYYIGCGHNIEIENQRKRYEGAYALLSSFSTLPPKARILLKVIAFKFNWIESLTNLSNISKGAFDSVVDFYNDRQSQKVIFKESDPELFVEDEIEQCINAIIEFQNGNRESVTEYLNNWKSERINSLQDINQKDRIFLLKAKMYPDSVNKYLPQIKMPFIRKRIGNKS